jgi:putative ABC transport system permease protein
MYKRVRTLLTVLSIAVAFLLYSLLIGANAVFNQVADSARDDLLIVTSRTRSPMPVAYLTRIAEVPGVRSVAKVSWLGGAYQDAKNPLGLMAVDPEELFRVNPDWSVSAEHRAAFAATRTGVLLGRRLQQKFGWKVGDQIPVMSRTFRSDGSTTWNFDVVGVYDNVREPAMNDGAIIHYAYLDESRVANKGAADMYFAAVADPKDAAAVADNIDKGFANSSSATASQPARDLARSFNRRLGDISLFVNAVVGAVFFTVLLLACTTMMQSFRERTVEIGVLRAIGFSHAPILLVVFGEAFLIFASGAIVGIGAALFVFPSLSTLLGTGVGALLNGVQRPPMEVFVVALLTALVFSFVSAFPPAVRALRLQVTEALMAR